MFCFFGREACGILAPWPGIEPAPPILEGEILTTGPPGKSREILSSGLKGEKMNNPVIFNTITWFYTT